MRLALAAVALVVASPAWAADDPAVACGASALTDYTRAVAALWNAPESQPLPSVEAVLKKRRMQEAYCLKSTGCILGTPTSITSDLAFRAAFASCLEEEAQQDK